MAVILAWQLYRPLVDKLNKGEITKLSIATLQIEFARSEFGKANELLPAERSPISPTGFGSLAERIKRTATKLSGAKALWVDDANPTENFLERRALSSIGISFDLARSTTEAQQLFDQADRMHSPYDFVVSDYRRDSDRSAPCYPTYSGAPSNAGCDLLQAVLQRYKAQPPPVIFYSLKGDQMGTPPGAFGSTTRFDSLVQLVLDAVERRQPIAAPEQESSSSVNEVER